MRSLLIIFLGLASLQSLAQSAIIRHNIVILDNEELFKIYATGTFSHQTFKVKTLHEDDLILVDQSTLRNDQGTLLMKCNFSGMPKAEAYIPMNINFRKHLARLLVNYNVIKNEKLNEQGVMLFCKNYDLSNYPSKYIADELSGSKEKRKTEKEKPTREQPAKVTPENNEAEVILDNEDQKTPDPLDENGNVKRDITQQIYLSGSKIRQDYKEIGSFNAEKKMLLGQEGKQITFYSINGNKLAIARFINGDEQCELMTVNDNKTWNIPIPKGDIYTIVKDLVKVLAERSYM